MRAISIDAKSLSSARRLYWALVEFRPELSGTKDSGYRVSFEVGGGDDRRLVELLDAIQQYVTQSPTEAAPIDLDGHRYTFHPAHV